MAGAKRIVAVDVREFSQLRRKGIVASFFARIETQVLKQQYIAIGKCSSFCGCLLYTSDAADE